MKQIINEKGITEIIFQGKLVSLSETTLVNTNGNNYKVGVIEFANHDGELVERTCQVYEGNYSKGMTVGKNYRATVRKGDDGQRYIQLSHLSYADNASVEDFPDELFEVTPQQVQSNISQTVLMGTETL